jgi:pSer/pThr/pTyr-binding forkhead associated (FHA) protein
VVGASQEWSGVPSASFSLEVLKAGTVAASQSLEGQPFCTFGRHPECDVVLEHPSASRLHAVLQFKPAAGGGEAFVWDSGSTHGTWVNKRPVNARVFVPLRVGDQLRFGQSTRVYVLCGPAALMPEEGLSRAERQQLRVLEAAAARAEEEAMRAMALVKARAAAGGRTGATWGQDLSEAGDFGEDVGAAAALGLHDLDWRTYTGKLNDRQEKAREKLRRKEVTIANLRSEIERISVKESGQAEGLTAGQAAQVARNEQRIEQLEAELEDAGEALNEQLRESALARAKGQGDEAAEAAIRAHASKQRARGRDDDEDAAAGSDSDDIVFDRTQQGKRPRTGPVTQGAAGAVHGAASVVETVESLWAKREATRTQLASAQEAAAGAVAATASDASVPAGGDDELDTFMGSVDAQLRQGTVAAAQAEVARLAEEEARLSRLIKVADPSGFYAGPSAAAPRLNGEHPASKAMPPTAAAAQAALVAASVLKAPQSAASAEAPGLAVRSEGAVTLAADLPEPDDGFLSPAELRAQQQQPLNRLPGAPAAERGGLIHMRAAKKAGPGGGAGAGPAQRDKDPHQLEAAAAAAAAADVARLLGGAATVEEDEDDPSARDEEPYVPPWLANATPTSGW